jgi:hypothetical protein
MVGAALVHSRARTAASLLQLIGAGCLLLLVLTHFCEGLQLFPSMRWGDPHSVGHYFNLSSALLGASLFPVGYLLHAFRVVTGPR